MATNTSDSMWALGSLRQHWGWMLAFGILMLVLGAIGLYMTATFTLASVLVFGALLVIGGVDRGVPRARLEKRGAPYLDCGRLPCGRRTCAL